MTLDTARILVIGVPIFLAPGKRGQRLLRIGNGTVFGKELLAELHGACGAHLHASRARYALFAVYLRNIGRPTHVRRVEQLRCTQRIADVHIAIADGEDLIGSIDVGDLVDITVALGKDENVHDLVVGSVMALARLHAVVGHITEADAPVLRVGSRITSTHALGCTT